MSPYPVPASASTCVLPRCGFGGVCSAILHYPVEFDGKTRQLPCYLPTSPQRLGRQNRQMGHGKRSGMALPWRWTIFHSPSSRR